MRSSSLKNFISRCLYHRVRSWEISACVTWGRTIRNIPKTIIVPSITLIMPTIIIGGYYLSVYVALCRCMLNMHVGIPRVLSINEIMIKLLCDSMLTKGELSWEFWCLAGRWSRNFSMWLGVDLSNWVTPPKTQNYMKISWMRLLLEISLNKIFLGWICLSSGF